MSQTLTLWDTVPHPRARAVDTQTALDAARSITPGRTERHILDLFHTEPHLWALGGMTDDEIAARLPLLYPPTCKSARSRLTNQGLRVDSGERRPSIRGRDLIGWRLE